jgi:hypothetical protein
LINNKEIEYLYVGGHKCGSTWLHDMIVDHPSVSTPKKKEPFFFDSWYERGFEEYHKLWEGSGIRGEFSTRYFDSRETMKRIHDYNPNLIIIINVRSPTDRIISHYRHQKRLDRNKYKDLKEFIERNKSSVSWSCFGENITNVLEYFPKSQIIVNFFEDIRMFPEDLIRLNYKAIGVDEGHTPLGLKKVSGQGFTPRNQFLEVVRQSVFHFLYDSGFQNVINFLRKAGIGRLYRKINSNKEDEVYKIGNDTISIFKSDLILLIDIVNNSFNGKGVLYIDKWIKELDEQDFKG